MSQRRLYLHLYRWGYLKQWTPHDKHFTKPIARVEWLLLNKKQKKAYNRFAMSNNLKPYEREKKENCDSQRESNQRHKKPIRTKGSKERHNTLSTR